MKRLVLLACFALLFAVQAFAQYWVFGQVRDDWLRMTTYAMEPSIYIKTYFNTKEIEFVVGGTTLSSEKSIKSFTERYSCGCYSLF